MDSTEATPVVKSKAGIIYKAGKRIGRGVPEIFKVYSKKCSCFREKTTVFCRYCGYSCQGRVRLQCEQHPRVSFLLDISECPRCHASTYLDEYAGGSK